MFCIHPGGGVGGVGACNNVHVNLRRKDMLLCKFSGNFHSCVMPHYCKFSGTFHSYVMLRYCKFSGTFHSCVMARYCKFSGTFPCVHVVLALYLKQSRSAKVLGRTRSVAVTNTGIKTCQVECFENSHKPKNGSFVRQNACF